MRGRKRSPRGARAPVALAGISAAAAAAAYRDPVVEALEQRAYNAAQLTRLNSDWSVSHLDANEEIRRGLHVVRAASRNLERNSDLYRRFLGLVQNNVVHRGYQLRSTPRNARGEVDATAAQQIEAAFRRWARGKITLDGRHTFAQAQRLAIRTVPRDGEVLVRRHMRRSAAGDLELRIELLEADYLPIEQHRPRERTVLGITFDEDMRPATYWLCDQHPGSEFGGYSRYSVRGHAASEIVHAFISERAGQARGVPWGSAAFDDLLMLMGYKVAELAAARLAAARPVALETERGADDRFTGDRKTAQGTVEFDGGPGGLTRLFPGQKLVPLSAEHPSGTYGPFTTEVKRDAAAGLEVSYHALNSDLGAANYSSLRHGRADEIRRYESVQDFFAADYCSPIFLWWLELWLASGRSGLPFSKIEKFAEHEWSAPAFEPLDPHEEAQAIELELTLGLTTRTREAQKRGLEFPELVRERKAEEALLEAEGVELSTAKSTAPAPAATPAEVTP